MSEGFLSRWSRRKRQETAGDDSTPSKHGDEADRPENIDKGKAASAPASPSSAGEEPAFDPASLPPIESIGPQSDVRAFLQPAVPAALTRAALRRAWTADPAIRDFVGLAENSWDFNAPESVPGFASSVSSEDVKRMLARVLPQDAEPKAGGKAEDETRTAEISADHSASPGQAQVEEAGNAEAGEEAAPLGGSDGAVHKEEAEDEQDIKPRPRGHGKAVPG
jgi:hypothetical protein